MRFIFVDRLVALEPARSIETLKNVSATRQTVALPTDAELHLSGRK